MSDVEVVQPDAVYTPSGEQVVDHPLNPCPNCGAVPHDQPELFGRAGKTVKDALEWTKEHCWKCGYIPDTAVEEKQKMQQMWAAFQSWYKDRPELQHPSVSADNPGANPEAVKSQLGNL